MNNLAPINLDARGVDTRSLMRRLAQAPVSELPQVMAEARAVLATADPDWISGRVAALLSHYWRPDDPGHLAEAVFVDWIDALSIYPSWAIAAAVTAWHRTSDGRRPTPAHIVRLCEAELRPLREEMARARSALSRRQDAPPPPPTAEQKARIDALIKTTTKRWV